MSPLPRHRSHEPLKLRPRRLLASASAAGVVLALAGATGQLQSASSTTAAPEAYGMWPASSSPGTPADPDTQRTTVGVKFATAADGWVSAIQFYRSEQNTGPHKGQLWTARGRLLATVDFGQASGAGWHTATLSEPVPVRATGKYVASYTAPKGRYADDQFGLSPRHPVVQGDLTGLQGVYTYGAGVPTQTWHDSNYYVDVVFSRSKSAAVTAAKSEAASGSTAPTSPSGSSTPEPTPTVEPSPAADPAPSSTTDPSPTASVDPTTSAPDPAPTETQTTNAPSTTSTATTTPAPSTGGGSGGFPNSANTGVPDGVTLTDYTGPTTITQAGTVIDAKRIRGTLVIAADNVTIKRSMLVGNIDSDRNGVHVTIIDSEVDGGTSSAPAIGYGDITMSRVDVHGSRVSVLCGSNCLIEDSWLHGQYLQPGSDWHVNGYVSNGGSNVVVRHNTIACEPKDNSNGGGCTGPGASFGDFAPLKNITYDSNLFVAGPGGYCLHAGYNPSKPYGSNPSGIVVTNNVFQRGPGGKCGYWGPVTSFLKSGTGNVWSNNTWDDGAPVPAA